MKGLLTMTLLALALAPAAAAAAPVQETIAWDRIRVIAASSETCPFDIQVHSTGTIHVWTFDDGRVMTILQDFHTVWTNLDTRATASSPIVGPQIVTPDGAVIVNGNNGRFVAAGEGPVFADVGRTVTLAEEVIFAAGLHSETLFPNVCAALD
jgi:hypothetical protein